MTGSKAWWTSKTIWVNAVALVGSAVMAYSGMTPEQWGSLSTVLLAAVNVGLRVVTGEPLDLGKPE